MLQTRTIMALMKIVTVFCIAAVTTCYGATTPAPLVPKTSCGISAQMCYFNQTDAMTENFAANNFARACMIYKSIITCMYNIPGNCARNSEFRAVRAQVDSDQGGMCGVDGSLQSCGYDLQACFNDMDAVLADALIRNFSSACPLITKFVTCSNTAVQKHDCPAAIVTKIQALQQGLVNDKDPFGCNGPCAEAISFCTLKGVSLPSNLTFSIGVLETYCNAAVGVNKCLNNLTTSAACASTPSTYLKDVAQNELASIGDVCNADGTISNCVTDLLSCVADLNTITSATSVTAKCQVASQFLECISDLPCVSALAPMITKLRNELETAEIEDTCPSVGSCDDRWSKCAQYDSQLGQSNMTNAETTTVCNTASKGRGCFKFVTNDPICINEKNQFITEKKDLDMLYNIQCGGAGVSWKVHLFLFVAALLASFKLYY